MWHRTVAYPTGMIDTLPIFFNGLRRKQDGSVPYRRSQKSQEKQEVASHPARVALGAFGTNRQIVGNLPRFAARFTQRASAKPSRSQPAKA